MAEARERKAGAGRFVLIVEDNLEVRNTLGRLLTAEGYRVRTVTNGAEALAVITDPRGELPDVVLLDLGLPAVSGVEFLTELRQNPRTPKLPVVVLTGRADLEEEKAVRQLGVSSYLKKPASREELCRALSRAAETG